MKRPFCDVCEKEIVGISANPNGISARQPWNTAPDIKAGKVPNIVVVAHFTFVDHPAGFGGPPDLCRSCRIRLLNDLVVTQRVGGLPSAEQGAHTGESGEVTAPGCRMTTRQLFHHLWVLATKSPVYDKEQWINLQSRLGF